MYKIEKKGGGVCAPAGFYANGVSAGLKPNNQLDLAFIKSDVLCDISAVFTTNKMQAAPIKHFKNKDEFQTNFILINSKNANAMTGKAGIKDIDEILSTIDGVFNPIMSSTGVIGVRLPKEKIINGIKKFDFSYQNSINAAKAIMTTDTFFKQASYEVVLEDGGRFRIGAIAKGAGMIDPAMATMLCFITTDANIPKEDMDELLKKNVKTTFNAISVDGDTSTNDSVILLSNKKSPHYHKEAFDEVLNIIMLELAQMMVRDGEGATKFVRYKITGAKDDKEAEIVAKALSDSLLVKTALYGEDPNWGRIASTIGASGVEAYEDSITICFDDVCVYKKGENLFSEDVEKQAAMVMKQDEFSISCDLGVGEGSFIAYGCDLGYEYVKINADYRT